MFLAFESFNGCRNISRHDLTTTQGRVPCARRRQAEPPARLGLPAAGGRPGGPGRRRRRRDRHQDRGAQGDDDGRLGEDMTQDGEIFVFLLIPFKSANIHPDISKWVWQKMSSVFVSQVKHTRVKMFLTQAKYGSDFMSRFKLKLIYHSPPQSALCVTISDAAK